LKTDKTKLNSLERGANFGKMRTIFFSSILLLAAACSQPASKPAEAAKTIYLNSKQVDCTGVAPMKCLQYRETSDGSWLNWYSGIEGFTYEEGNFYTLEIKEEKVANPPADGSSIKWILVKEVKKEKDPAAGAGEFGVPDLASVENIDKYRDMVLTGMDDYKKTTADVNRGDSGFGVTTVTDNNGAARMVKAELKAKGPITTWEYYLAGGKVVMLRETIMGKVNTENRFYYADGKLLKAIGKDVPGRMAPEGVPFKEFVSKTPDTDFRLKYAEVQKSADDFLAGK